MMDYFHQLLESHKLLKQRKLRIRLNESDDLSSDEINMAVNKATEYANAALNGVPVEVVGTPIILSLDGISPDTKQQSKPNPEMDLVRGWNIPGLNQAGGAKVFQGGVGLSDPVASPRKAWSAVVRAIAKQGKPEDSDASGSSTEKDKEPEGLLGQDLIGIKDVGNTNITDAMVEGMSRLTDSIQRFQSQVFFAPKEDGKENFYNSKRASMLMVNSANDGSTRLRISKSKTKEGVTEDGAVEYEELDEGAILESLDAAKFLFDKIADLKQDITSLSYDEADIISQSVFRDKYGARFKGLSNEGIGLFKTKPNIQEDDDFGIKAVNEYNREVSKLNRDRETKGMDLLPLIPVRETAKISGRLAALRGTVGEHLVEIGVILQNSVKFRGQGNELSAKKYQEMASKLFRDLSKGNKAQEIFDVFEDQMDLVQDKILSTDESVTHAAFVDAIHAKVKGLTGKDPIKLVIAANKGFTENFYNKLGARPDGMVHTGAQTENVKGAKGDLKNVFHSQDKIELIAKNLGTTVDSLISRKIIKLEKAGETYRNSPVEKEMLKDMSPDQTVWTMDYEVKMKDSQNSVKGGEATLSPILSDFTGQNRPQDTQQIKEEEKKFLEKVTSKLGSAGFSSIRTMSEAIIEKQQSADKIWNIRDPNSIDIALNTFESGTLSRFNKRTAKHREIKNKITILKRSLKAYKLAKKTNDPSVAQQEQSLRKGVKELKGIQMQVTVQASINNALESQDRDTRATGISFLAHNLLYSGGSMDETIKDSRTLGSEEQFIFLNNKALEGPVLGLLSDPPTHGVLKKGSTWGIHKVDSRGLPIEKQQALSLRLELKKGTPQFVQVFSKKYLRELSGKNLLENYNNLDKLKAFILLQQEVYKDLVT